jgi:hypothetical protein
MAPEIRCDRAHDNCAQATLVHARLPAAPQRTYVLWGRGAATT